MEGCLAVCVLCGERSEEISVKQNFWSKLKEVSLADFWHVLLFFLALFPAWVYRRRRKHLWLICENQKEARDNGYWLFKYICENHPECDAAYAIDPKSADYEKAASLGQVISYGTFLHWIYYLAAEVNISSQKGGKPNAAVCYFLEVYGLRKNTRVFLQHGVIKDDLPFLHYENAKFSMFVTSALREYEYVRDNFNYPPGAVKLLGLCRFDRLHGAKADPDLIVAMPTWRSWISPPSNGKAEFEDIEAVKGSEYCRGWNDFLQDGRLGRLLEQYGKRLVFYQHREMQKFKGLFLSGSDRIAIGDDSQYDVQELLMSGAFLITDYSSVAMDFAYMGKPLCYYQFDYEKFRGSHYPEGYFSYEKDGFGPVCRQSGDVLDVLEANLSGNGQGRDIYKERRESFFTLNDDENCRRNYEAIADLARKIDE